MVDELGEEEERPFGSSPEAMEEAHAQTLAFEGATVDTDEPEEEPEALFPPAAPPRSRPEELLNETLVNQFYASIVVDGADRLKMLGRHRTVRPWSERARAEERARRQIAAIAHAEQRAAGAVMSWLDDQAASPWAWWAAAQLCPADDAAGGVAAKLAALPSGSRLAEGIVEHHLATGAPIEAWARALLSSERGAVVALGIEILSMLDLLDTDGLLEHLLTTETDVARASLRGLLRSVEGPGFPEQVAAFLEHDDDEVVWLAAYALAIWRDHETIAAARQSGRLLQRIGGRAAELFVLHGQAEDVAALQRIVTAFPVTQGTLSAVARFGHPTVWAFLVHHLGDPMLHDAAERALETLYGPLCPPMASPAQWEEAIAEAPLDPALRYRGGKPWSPAVVADELACGELTRVEMEARIDELRARLGLRLPPTLIGWGEAAGEGLAALIERARAESKRHHAGSWT